MRDLMTRRFDAGRLRAHAERFSTERFEAGFRAVLSEVW
jgi:hypothetical protein